MNILNSLLIAVAVLFLVLVAVVIMIVIAFVLRGTRQALKNAHDFASVALENENIQRERNKKLIDLQTKLNQLN